MSDTESEARSPNDFEKRLSWVEERLRELGFNDLQSANLAEAGVDWHRAKRLIEKGCSHETAVDLLL